MKITYIELKGEQHPLCFNLSAIEKICDEFGDLEKMADMATAGNNAQKIRTVTKLLKILLASGREYCVEMEIELPKEIKNPAAVIDINSSEVFSTVFNAVQNDSERKIEVSEKNGKPTQDN